MGEKINEIICGLGNLPIAKRLVSITEKFIGYPYVMGNEITELSEQNSEFTGFDCMTYVETCLALAISSSPYEFLPNLYAIRYFNSNRSPSNRKHFAYADWLRSNHWILEECSQFEGSIATIIKRINREKFFREKNIPLPKELKPVEYVVISYIPVASMIYLYDNIYVVLFVSNSRDLDIQHMGFCINTGKTHLLRHASSKHRQVVDEPFWDYLYDSDAIGIVVAKPYQNKEGIFFEE